MVGVLNRYNKDEEDLKLETRDETEGISNQIPIQNSKKSLGQYRKISQNRFAWDKKGGGISVWLKSGITFSEISIEKGEYYKDNRDRLWVKILGQRKFMLGVVYVQPETSQKIIDEFGRAMWIRNYEFKYKMYREVDMDERNTKKCY